MIADLKFTILAPMTEDRRREKVNAGIQPMIEEIEREFSAGGPNSAGNEKQMAESNLNVALGCTRLYQVSYEERNSNPSNTSQTMPSLTFKPKRISFSIPSSTLRQWSPPSLDSKTVPLFPTTHTCLVSAAANW